MIWLWVMLAGCGPKETPAHLRPEPSTPSEVAQAPGDLEAAVEILLNGDPLARRASPPEALWPDLEQGEALEAWAQVARIATPNATEWDAVEAAWPATVAVPLSRGARLAALETRFAAHSGDEADARSAEWLRGLHVSEASATRGARPALAWIARDPETARRDALYLAERDVLLGWLHGPAIPVEPVARAMRPGVHDRLMDAPTGRLLLARAAGASDSAAGARGAERLGRATLTALQRAAADRDAEQAEWNRERARLGEELGDAPVAILLEGALADLTADAAATQSTGLALVAITAQRLEGSCPDRPCAGLDRMAQLEHVQGWGPAPAALAVVWRVIALKQAVDRFEVAHDKPSFALALADIADALVGATGNRVDLALLRQGGATPTAYLSLSRVAGGQEETTYEGTLLALKARLADMAQRGLDTLEQAPGLDQHDRDAVRELLERVRRRAS